MFRIMVCCNCVWILISFVTSCAGGAAFYFPYWIRGELPSLTINDEQTVPTYFGSFRRCTFPRRLENGGVEIVEECGRYKTFHDIPSWAWQVTTVSGGVGCGLSLLASLIAVIACWMPSIWNKAIIRSLGLLHLFAGICISVALAIYPFGWGNGEMSVSCLTSHGHGQKPLSPFHLGNCELYYSFYVLGGCIITSIFLFLTSRCCSDKKDKMHKEEQEKFAAYEYKAP